LNQTDQLKDLVSLRDAGQAITGCKSNAHFLVWESLFFQVLSHQGESDCGSDVALPLHPAVISNPARGKGYSSKESRIFVLCQGF
jgi:hypothetical protein